MCEFRNYKELEQLLLSNGVDISTWGTGDAKTVTDLWKEIMTGDSYIHREPLLRIVEVVRIVIRRGNKVLVEVEQVLQDGRLRTRNILPSEKIRPYESCFEAAKRGIHEEMQIEEKDIEIFESSYRQEQEIDGSISYPGLRTLYKYHVVEAKVNSLPNKEFWSFENRNDQDPVKKHRWVWKNVDEEV